VLERPLEFHLLAMARPEEAAEHPRRADIGHARFRQVCDVLTANGRQTIPRHSIRVERNRVSPDLQILTNSIDIKSK